VATRPGDAEDPTGAPFVELLVEAVGLKGLPRTGWVRRGIPDPESVAAHSWGVAWLVLLLLPADLDRGRALTYAVLHDLAEVRVGDLTPHDAVDAEVKRHRERDALTAMLSVAGRGGMLREAWEAYEAQADPEARFVRQLDRLDMAIQAVAYADAGGQDLTEFLDSAERVIEDPSLARILATLRRRSRDASAPCPRG